LGLYSSIFATNPIGKIWDDVSLIPVKRYGKMFERERLFAEVIVLDGLR